MRISDWSSDVCSSDLWLKAAAPSARRQIWAFSRAASSAASGNSLKRSRFLISDRLSFDGMVTLATVDVLILPLGALGLGAKSLILRQCFYLSCGGMCCYLVITLITLL